VPLSFRVSSLDLPLGGDSIFYPLKLLMEDKVYRSSARG